MDFFGDAILIFFDPFDEPVEPMIPKSLQCAFSMRKSMNAFNRQTQAEKLAPLAMGIGINAGEVVVGNIGSKTRAKYGIVGSPVNLTQRIQSEAGSGEVIISQSLYRRIGNHHGFKVQRSFETSLKGIHGAMQLCVIRGSEGEQA